jgi:hypothetical protein
MDLRKGLSGHRRCPRERGRSLEIAIGGTDGRFRLKRGEKVKLNRFVLLSAAAATAFAVSAPAQTPTTSTLDGADFLVEGRKRLGEDVTVKDCFLEQADDSTVFCAV